MEQPETWADDSWDSFKDHAEVDTDEGGLLLEGDEGSGSDIYQDSVFDKKAGVVQWTSEFLEERGGERGAPPAGATVKGVRSAMGDDLLTMMGLGMAGGDAAGGGAGGVLGVGAFGNGTFLGDGGDFGGNVSGGFNRTLDPDMVFHTGHLISIVAYSCLLVLSAMGNLTVLVVILRRRRRSSPFSRIDFMLLHLAIADLIVTFFMMPLEIAWASTVYWRGGDLLCRVMAFLRIFGIYLSGFVLVCLALDRYLAVKHPMQMLGSGRRGKVMISWAWIISFLCSLPQAYIFHVESHPDFPWYTQCVTFGSLSESSDSAYIVFCFLMMYAIPFTVILLLYCGIVVELYRRTTESTKSNGAGCDGLRRSGLGNLGKAREKTLKMTVAIVAMFFICWTPYNVVSLWYIIDKNSLKNLDLRIQKALYIFACTNSTVNPIVYGIFHLKSTFSTSDTRASYYSRESVYRSTMSTHADDLLAANGHRRCASARGPVAAAGRVIVTQTSNSSTRSFYNHPSSMRGSAALRGHHNNASSIKRYGGENGANGQQQQQQRALVSVTWNNASTRSSFC